MVSALIWNAVKDESEIGEAGRFFGRLELTIGQIEICTISMVTLCTGREVVPDDVIVIILTGKHKKLQLLA